MKRTVKTDIADGIIADLAEIARCGESTEASTRDGSAAPSAALDPAEVERIVHRRNRGVPAHDHVSKADALRHYLQRCDEDPVWRERAGIDGASHARIVAALRMKPRRTASGVATVTVVTMPQACSGSCAFCPNDVRMPKSYLHDEPACQRAERALFDPYLQVAARLRALSRMGHDTSKVELIVLGGTWSDYPRDYQIWFATELFRALNDGVGETSDRACEQRRTRYAEAGVVCPRDDEELLDARADAIRAPQRTADGGALAARLARIADAQAAVDAGETTYNDAVSQLYADDPAWRAVRAFQTATLEDLDAQHAVNERAAHRCVGLVVETRPDRIDAPSLALIRRIGCTKVQIGVQSLDADVLAANGRAIDPARIGEAFSLLRAFGFKIHAHAMANLIGSDPERDARDYRRLVSDAPFQPDEVKIYPCVLVAGTELDERFERGEWSPYSEEELVDLLAANMEATPPFTRVSRMIRDISAHDIKAGNKRANLRQLVEQRVERGGGTIREIRHREIGAHAVDPETLAIDEVAYDTAASRERFLQWVTPEGRIAGFLRLSLPDADYMRAYASELPVREGEAMIREVHVYGAVARFHETSDGAQHLGLGRRLVERACAIARNEGYARINVISAVGTRDYYRALGFEDAGLYQQRLL